MVLPFFKIKFYLEFEQPLFMGNSEVCRIQTRKRWVREASVLCCRNTSSVLHKCVSPKLTTEVRSTTQLLVDHKCSHQFTERITNSDIFHWINHVFLCCVCIIKTVLSADILKENLQARSSWKEVFQVMKGKDLHPRMCPRTLSSKTTI